jgi:hypothetical protein
MTKLKQHFLPNVDK